VGGWVSAIDTQDNLVRKSAYAKQWQREPSSPGEVAARRSSWRVLSGPIYEVLEGYSLGRVYVTEAAWQLYPKLKKLCKGEGSSAEE